MPDVLVRGLSTRAIEHWTEEARLHAASRNEMLVHVLEEPVRQQTERRAATAEDWARFGRTCADLGNEEIMSQAWR